ncbi:hypothetical protein DOY81_005142, partial [Sarcophaga bullata]
ANKMWSYTVISLFVVLSMSAFVERPIRTYVPSRPKPQPPPLLNLTRGLNVHFKKLGWIRSLEYCRRKNQFLATITSKIVNDELVQSYTPYDLRDWRGGFWIGGYDIGHEDRFVWIKTGRTLAPFTNWKPGQPNNANGNENCLALLVSGKWADEHCLKRMPFICEELPTIH